VEPAVSKAQLPAWAAPVPWVAAVARFWGSGVPGPGLLEESRAVLDAEVAAAVP
jgi:hypothetical protein